MIFRYIILCYSGKLIYVIPIYCRVYYVCDRRLSAKFSQCVWKVLCRALLVRSEDDHCQKSISLKRVG